MIKPKPSRNNPQSSLTVTCICSGAIDFACIVSLLAPSCRAFRLYTESISGSIANCLWPLSTTRSMADQSNRLHWTQWLRTWASAMNRITKLPVHTASQMAMCAILSGLCRYRSKFTQLKCRFCVNKSTIDWGLMALSAQMGYIALWIAWCS